MLMLKYLQRSMSGSARVISHKEELFLRCFGARHPVRESQYISFYFFWKVFVPSKCTFDHGGIRRRFLSRHYKCVDHISLRDPLRKEEKNEKKKIWHEMLHSSSAGPRPWPLTECHLFLVSIEM